jgi:hypothetical protein
LRKTGDSRLEDHIVHSRIAQGEREAQNVSEAEVNEIVETWVILKMKALQSPIRRSLTEKFCPKCRNRHEGVDEKAGAENEHEHVEANQPDAPAPGEAAGNGNEAVEVKTTEVKPIKMTPTKIEPVQITATEVEPAKTTATIVTSSVIA